MEHTIIYEKEQIIVHASVLYMFPSSLERLPVRPSLVNGRDENKA